MRPLRSALLRSTAAAAALLVPALGMQGTAGAAAAAGSASSPVASGTAGYCRTDTGVTVVVDFRALGGPVVVRCAPGPGGPGFSGIDALQQAGFTPTGTARYGLAFVCRINGRPGPDETLAVRDNPDYQEKCETTPPQSAYWGYWYAPNGGSWTYSNRGAANRDAIPGGFEGWAFSLNGARPAPGVVPRRPVSASPSPSAPPPPSPSVSPRPATTRPAAPTSAAPAPAPAPASRRASPSPAPGGGSSPAPSSASSDPGPTKGSASGDDGEPPTARPDKHGRPRPSSPSATSITTATTPAAPSTTTADAGDVIVTGDLPAPPNAPERGSPRALIAGLALLAALATAAGVTAWRRSRHG